MKTSKQLIEDRSTVTARIAELSGLESLNDAQTTELRSAIEKEEKLNGEVELALSLEKRNAEQAAREARNAAANGLTNKPNGEEKEVRQFSLAKVIDAKLNQKPITGLEKELVDDAQAEARSNGFKVEGIYLDQRILNALGEKRAMSVGSSTAGGNTVQTDKVGWFDALYAKRVLAQLGVKYFSGLSNNVDLTGLSTGVTTYWGTEVATLSDGSPVTASRSMTPKKLGAYVPMSNQLLIQNPQLEGHVLNSMMEAIYVAVEAAYINGSGASGQPTGLLGTSGIQNVAMGTNGGAPTLAKLLELVEKLGTANARVEDLKFLINPKVEGKLKQTSIDSGSGAMIMAYQQYFNGQPGVIDGKITAITSNVPSNLDKGTSTGVCSAIICGQFDKSVIGQFGGMDLIIDPYTLAANAQTRLIANTYWDMAWEQPAVFGAILDATTT